MQRVHVFQESRMLFVAIVTALVALTECCQEIRLIAQDGSVVLGRSFEFHETVPLEWYLVSEPAGKHHEIRKLPNCDVSFTFTNLFKVIRFTGKLYNETWAKKTVDGFNEEGLSMSLLWFEHYAEFTNPLDITGEACNNSVPQTSLVAYVIATYSTVREVKRSINNGLFPVVWDDEEVWPVLAHYNIVDKTGEGIVLEYVAGQRTVQVYDNTVGVMTNSPPYPWHMINLRNYPNLTRDDKTGFSYKFKHGTYTLQPYWTGSGLVGLPGDYTSPSRFVKAASLLAKVIIPKTSEGAIVQVFHLMNAADIPYGVDITKEEQISYTWWSIVKDLKGGCVYYRGYTDLSVKRVCLNEIPDVAAAVKIEGRFTDGFRDTSKDLQPIEIQDSEAQSAANLNSRSSSTQYVF